MKKISFILFLSLYNVVAYTQSKAILLSSFGAVPNDGLTDQPAFNAAATYINKSGGNVRLIISKGKYNVGPAFRYSGDDEKIPAATLNNVMLLQNCKNVTIEGMGSVTITFLNDMPFGTLPNRPAGADSGVHIGSLFRFINCTGITINNIKANGNNEKFRLLKTWGLGSNPFEREHEGLFIFNCSNVNVTSSSFNYFGRDGVLILADTGKLPVKNIFFSSCTFDHNGRNGASWTAGDNIQFYKCSFNYNGTGKIRTNPGAGLDIEPERNAVCNNGKFTRCEFRNNGGYAVTSGYTTAANVQFDSCVITGSSNYALLCASPGYVFKNSTIAGTSLFSYDAFNTSEGIKCINCIFTDSISGIPVWATSYIAAITGRYVKFSNCTFKSYKMPSLFTEVRKRSATDDAENTLFLNCSFYALFTKPGPWQRNAFLISNCIFMRCIFNTNGYADFKYLLELKEKNNRQEQSKFLKLN